MKKNLKKKIALLLSVVLSMSFFSSLQIMAEDNAPVSTVDGFLDVEVEDMPYDPMFFGVTEKAIYSGGKALSPKSEDKTVPGAKEPAHLDLSFTADRDGTYHLWVRHTGEIVNQRGQSVFLSLGGGAYNNTRLTGEGSDPVWLKLGTVSVKKGAVGSVRLCRRQTYLIGFDRYIVTRNESYVPSDIELGIVEDRPQAVTFETQDGQATVEAEDISVFNNFSITQSFKMSGGVGLRNTKAMSASTLQSNRADAAFNIKCNEPGTYYIWGYVRGDTSSNILLASVNNGTYSTISVPNGNGKYSWQKLLVVPGLEKGDTINVRLRTNKGTTNIDKFCVVNDILQQPYGLVGDLIKKDTTVELYNGYKASVEKPTGHPRLYFTSDDIPDIIANKDKKQMVYGWAAQEKNVAGALKDTFTGKLAAPAAGKSNSNNGIMAQIESLAFDYAVNGNPESGKKAITAMENYLNTVVYIGHGGDNYVRNAGQTIFHASEVYDWCYDLMDDETKDYYIERCIEIAGDGLECKWPFIGNGVAGHVAEAQVQRDLLAFAVAVADERPDVYDRMMSLLYQNYVPARQFVYEGLMHNQGSQYGGYRGQWEVNASFIMDKIGVENFYGENQHYFPYFYLYARRPDGLIMRDGDAKDYGNTIGAYATRPDQTRVMLFAASQYQDGYLMEEFNRQWGFGKSLSSGHGNITPVEFICVYNPEVANKNRKELPLTRYFPSPRGAMIARTGWEDGIDSPAVVAFMNLEKYNFTNHDHLDAGHFQIYYKGILANDSGSYNSYGSAHDRGYYKRSVAHNTLAVRNPEKATTFQGYSTYDGGQRSPKNGADAGIELLGNEEYKFSEILGYEFGPDDKEPDYNFLSGNLTNAYYKETVDNYERSFMFYNLKDEEHPAAMVVFDRVTSQSAGFEKAWLLHGPTEPTVDKNRTVFVNDENGYNGKMTVDTLLPKADNTKFEVIGGEGQTAWVDRTDYTADIKLDKNLTHEAQGWRIEISPEKASAKDYFLNVIQVNDADGEIEVYTPELIETQSCVGAVLNNKVTLFKTDYGRSTNEVAFTLGDGEYDIHIADNTAGEWIIYKNGEIFKTVTATDEGGLLSFKGNGGSYKAVFSGSEVSEQEFADTDEAQEKTLPDYSKDIDVKIYNNYLYTPVMGKRYDGNLYIPLRALAEKLGAAVTWENNKAVVTDGKVKYMLSIGSDIVEKNDGGTEKLPYPTIECDGAIMVPPYFFASCMYCTWIYDEYVNCVQFKNYTRGTAEDKNGNLYFPTDRGLENELKIYAILQSGSENAENSINKVLDASFENRWAVQGTMANPSWGIFDLGSIKELDKIYIAYYSGSSRKAYFKVEVSEDGENFTTVIADGESSGETDEFESYELGGVRGRYVKIYGLGNNSSASASWNSISELAITGK